MAPVLRIACILAASLSCFIAPRATWAGSYWFEFGGGVAQLEKTSAFFRSGAPDSLSMAPTYQFAAGIRIFKGALPVHFGLQHRIVTASDGTNGYGLQTTYPMLRFDGYRIYFGIGWTPLVRKSSVTGGSAGILGGYSSETGTTAWLGEIGVQFPITPEVSFNVQTSTQWVYSPSGPGPQPSMEITALFRFFYGSEKNTKAPDRRKYEGFRYPYGVELRR
jgi:hypothetical protein